MNTDVLVNLWYFHLLKFSLAHTIQEKSYANGLITVKKQLLPVEHMQSSHKTLAKHL